MSNKIIYPVLIIIFSILIIFAILQNKNNKKLNSGLEKFMNNYLEYEKNNLKLNVENNLAITKEFANGTWTSFNTNIDSNYNATNLITINIDNIPSIDNSNNKIFGTIILNGNTFIINFISNEIIIADYNNVQTLNIKLLNMFSPNENKININPTYNIPNTPISIISFLSGDTLLYKIASYKIYNNKVSGEIYRIIKSQNYFINDPPEIYDFKTYNKIISNYQFSNNLIKLTFGTSHDEIKKIIINSYGGSIKFSIRRVFYSPSKDGKEIITKNSIPLVLNVLNNDNIPNNIVIRPFSNDKDKNNLNSFFKPKATILYFYKITNYSSTYNFSDKNPISVSKNVLKLQNDADNMFKDSIQYDNLTSVERTNTSTFNMTYVTTVNSNLNDSTIIPFSDLYNLLLKKL